MSTEIEYLSVTELTGLYAAGSLSPLAATEAALAAIAAGAGASLHPDIPLAWWLVPGAVTAAIAELLPIPFDDNLSVPLAAAGIMALLAMI